MASLQSEAPSKATSRTLLLGAVVVTVALFSWGVVRLYSRHQAAGVDFSCFWAGAKVAWHGAARLYDFRYITELQGWPLGPESLRPFIYPPSALFLFLPFAISPYWVDSGLCGRAMGRRFVSRGTTAGVPWCV